MTDQPCFGFYSGGPVCATCTATKRCKAIVVSNGFDIVADALGQMLATLPDQNYRDTDRVSELVDQLLDPPENVLSAEAVDVLRELDRQNDLNLDDL
jgi:hypothetical protein